MISPDSMASRASTRGRSKEHHVTVGLGFLSALKRGELDACVELLHPEIEWHPSPRLLDAEVVRGHDDVRQHIQTLHEQFGESLDVIPEDGRQIGDHVLLITMFKGSNKFTARAFQQRECWVVSVRDDQWARVVVYPNPAAARLGFEAILKAGESATNSSEEEPSGVTIPDEMAEAAPTPAEFANSAPNGGDAGAATTGNSISLTFTFEEAEALNRWMLKPSQDGGIAGDDAAVLPGLMKIRTAVERAQAVAAVRHELEQAGVPTQHLSDQQVAQLGRRISQTAPRLGGTAPAKG